MKDDHPDSEERGMPPDTNIIVCWSGEIGRKVARQLVEWLDELHTGFKPWHSDDLAKGEVWRKALGRQLAQVKAGIICVTPGALASPWIHFEAGHLARLLVEPPDAENKKGSKSESVNAEGNYGRRVFPFLFRVRKSEMHGPLADYQATEPDSVDVNRLVRSLGWNFDVDVAGLQEEAWQKLEKRLNEIPFESLGEIIPDLEMKFRRKTFDEPVDECISQRWKQRYAGAMTVVDQLNATRPAVLSRAAPSVLQSYDELIRSVDYYSDAMGAELLEERQFSMNGKRLELPPESVSEMRRRDVGCRLLHALNPLPVPNLEPQARLYEKYRLYCDDRAYQLVQGIDAILKDSDDEHDIKKPEYVVKCLSSPWPFDRIAAYLAIGQLERECADLPADTLIAAIDNELKTIGLHPSLPATVDLEPVRFAVLSLARRPDLGRPPAAAREILERVIALAEKMSGPERSPADANSLIENAGQVLAGLARTRREARE